MDMLFSVDRAKCQRCGLCLKVCSSGALVFSKELYPALSKEGAERCKKCQHCLAVCPAGALSIFGRKAEACPPGEPLAKPEEVRHLIQFRRSCRHYEKREVAPTYFQKLLEMLAYVPTGCNDHRLHFAVVDKFSVMEEIRRDTASALVSKLEANSPDPALNPFRGREAALKSGIDVIFRGAPHLIVAAVPDDAPCALADPVIAVSYLELYANSLGLGTCWCGMALWAMEALPELRARMMIPADCTPRAALLLGYPELQFRRATLPEPVSVNFVG